MSIDPLRARVELRYDTNNMAGATAGAELTTRTVVVEIKYFCTKNVVIHTENCKLNLPLDCSTTQMEKNIRRMCGIDESSRRKGFADFALEVFYIHFIEAGCSQSPCMQEWQECEVAGTSRYKLAT